MRLLVIEDEPSIRRFLRAGFSDSATEFFEAVTGAEGIRMTAQKMPDLVLLDLGLPDIDGLEVLKQIREWTTVPVIVLSARGQEKDKIAALDQGADDYLTKPFSVGELLARVRVALRHSVRAESKSSIFECGPLRVDYGSHLVSIDGTEVRLTLIEYRLLTFLTQNAGKVVTQTSLLTEIWGPEFADATHTLRVHMGNLRQKLENPSGQRFIRTETGVGYRFVE